MKISFVIPAYNEEAVIGQCIESIQREIARGSYDAEILVVDNASTDKTRAIAASYPNVRVVEEKRKGTNWARQAGFTVATGDIIVNIDADCLVPNGWLNVVTSEFEKNPRVIALSGPYVYYDLPWWSQMLAWMFYGVIFIVYLMHRFILKSGSVVQGGNFAVRREALEKIGGFNTALEFYGDDTDTARRLSDIGGVKWTFRLRVLSSGRRFRKEGFVKTAFYYTLNHFWILFARRPHTTKYSDVRHGQ